MIYHTFIPGKIEASDESSVNDFAIAKRYALESAIYLSNEQRVTDKATVNYGLRYSNFTQLGPGNIYTYNDQGVIVDSADYADWQTVSSHNGIAPRISGSYLLNATSSIKASHIKNIPVSSFAFQYHHILPNRYMDTIQ